jgi:proteasome activator subunit 4
VWQETVSLYLSPHSSKSTFEPWEASEDVVQAIREVTTAPGYWENLSTYFSEENHETYISQDNVSCVKSICVFLSDIFEFQLAHEILVQLLDDEPFAAFKPTVESLIADKDHNKQRAAAEFLAGVLGGNVSYHIWREFC